MTPPIAVSHFKDDEGRTLMLRGVNLGGSSKTPSVRGDFYDNRNVSFVGRPFPLEEADEHFSRLRGWGLTFLRYLVTWEAIEHAGPGVYDRDYVDHVYALVRKAGEHGLRLCIDPHQDVWSRFSGGDGAPGWTFDAVGMDMTRFVRSGAAIIEELHGGPLPRMIWPTNATKLAAATMFTLFFGGNDFAPRARVDGEPVQEFLQRRYFGAMRQVAARLKGLPGVMGYGTMNEPQSGFIGWRDLTAPGGTLKLGDSPSPFQAMLLGAGFPQEVEVWDQRITGPRRIGRRGVDPGGPGIWRDGTSCVWRRNGVWDTAGDGTPRLMRPDHFHRVNGRTVDFSEMYFAPFVRRYIREIRSVDPDAAIFVETEVPHPPPRLEAEEAAGAVYAPHWYDGPVMFLKHYSPFLGYDRRRGRVILGRRAVNRSYAEQLRRFSRDSIERLRGAPVVLGEFGIPFDMDDKKAFRTGDWRVPIRAMDRSFRAIEAALMSCALWNYAPDNTNAAGDRWNGEDFSIYSRDQRADPNDIYSGGRALEAVVRPYAVAAAGDPLSMSFDIRTSKFMFVFRHDPSVTAPTEIFIPKLQYPRGCTVKVSDGTCEIDCERQTLTYRHTMERTVHTVRVRPAWQAPVSGETSCGVL